MSSRGAGKASTRSAVAAKAKAVVTQTHTLHARTANASKWHEVTVTRPDGREVHVSVNASVFPTRTAAKAEAIAAATGQQHSISTYMRGNEATPQAAFETAYNKLAGDRGVPEAQFTTLATYARSAGRTQEANLLQRLGMATDVMRQHAAVLAIVKPTSIANRAQRAEATRALAGARSDVYSLEQQLKSLHSEGNARPAPESAATRPSTSGRARTGGTQAPSMRGAAKANDALMMRMAAAQRAVTTRGTDHWTGRAFDSEMARYRSGDVSEPRPLPKAGGRESHAALVDRVRTDHATHTVWMNYGPGQDLTGAPFQAAAANQRTLTAASNAVPSSAPRRSRNNT